MNKILYSNWKARINKNTMKYSFKLSCLIKKSSFLYYSEEAIKEDGEKIINIANKEGLTAHANSVKVRLD